jgi:hypothetical protein
MRSPSARGTRRAPLQPLKATTLTDTPDGLRGPFLKLERALHHIEELSPLLHLFLRLQSYRAVADPDVQPGYIVWVARGKDLFPHDEFSPIIGAVVHNLRSSLDLAISALMKKYERPGKSYFPTFESFDEFKQRFLDNEKRKPNLPEHVVSVFQYEVQPYKGGNGHHLRTLNTLSNADKHRMIVPTVFGAVRIHMEAAGMKVPLTFFGEPAPIKNGARFSQASACTMA